MPAPLIVMLLTAMWPWILNVPAGIHTVPPAPAAAIAWFIAEVESATPDGSAPLLVIDTEPVGWLSGPATFSKSARSMVYDEAVESESTCRRNFVPAGYTCGKRRLTSS